MDTPTDTRAIAVDGSSTSMTGVFRFLVITDFVIVDIPVDTLADAMKDQQVATVTHPLTSGSLIVDTLLSVSFSVYRPYFRRPIEVQSSATSTVSGPEKSPIPDISNGTVAPSLPEPVESPSSTAPQDEITSDDKSDDSVVIVKSAAAIDEMEGVKRRWFREEMRQSPVSAVK